MLVYENVVRAGFRRRIDECRWDAAADWLSDGDADLYALTLLEVESLNRRLARRRLYIDAVQCGSRAINWIVRRMS